MKQLQRWHDDGLLSDEVWVERQRATMQQLDTPAAQQQQLTAAPTSPRGTISVVDFGAIGDGNHDDTAAIAAAIAAAGNALVFPSSRTYGCGAGCGVTGPEILFPAGTYAISSTLSPARWMRGEGGAMIDQRNHTADIFATAVIWRLRVQGLFLHGGRDHFNIGTNNTDASFFVFTQCTFSNASGSALRLRPPGSYYSGSGSTQVTVLDSKFFNNEQVAINNAGLMTIEDVWVEGAGYNQSAFKALFENYATMVLSRMLGVPATRKGIGQRWIDNYGDLTARNCRFGGEGEILTCVLNWFRHRLPPYLHLDAMPLPLFRRRHDRCSQSCNLPLLSMQPLRRGQSLPTIRA